MWMRHRARPRVRATLTLIALPSQTSMVWGVRVERSEELAAALLTLGIPFRRPVVVVVGGAGGLDPADYASLEPLFTEGIVPVINELGGVAVDGGTDSGVMRLLGRSRLMKSGAFPLVGVVSAGTVTLPGMPARDDLARMEPHHTQFVIVPGDEWGSEVPWIAETATVLASGAPSVTVLINGGEISYVDVEQSIAHRRRVVVLAGSGRTADQFDAALRGQPADGRAEALVMSGLVSSVHASDPSELRKVLEFVLARRPRGQREE